LKLILKKWLYLPTFVVEIDAYSNKTFATEQPALQFDLAPTGSGEFFSPLKNAMSQLGTSSSPTKRNAGFTSVSDDSDDDLTEDSPLLRNSNQATTGYSGNEAPFSPPNTSSKTKRRHIPTEISTGGPSTVPLNDNRRVGILSTKKRQRRSSVNAKPSLVLKELASGENEFSMDYKYILLEDLGSASSWIILLLPYIAFCISMLLESAKGLKTSTMGPLYAAMPCGHNFIGNNKAVLLELAPSLEPCHCSFFERKVYPGHHNKTFLSYDGTVFESGVMDAIPVVSTYLYGDAEFEGLSSEAVALVAQGMLESSVSVLERDIIGDQEWTLMFSSNPRPVSMACTKTTHSKVGSKTTWDCKTPRIVDVIFSMPETAVYAGGDIRVNVFYSFKQRQTQSDDNSFSYHLDEQVDTSHVYTKTKDDAEVLASIDVSEPSTLVEEIVASSSYTFERMSQLAMKLDTGVRLGTFLVSFWFIVYWCHSMGVSRLFCCCRKDSRGMIPLFDFCAD
jgi:hypothetical protein